MILIEDLKVSKVLILLMQYRMSFLWNQVTTLKDIIQFSLNATVAINDDEIKMG